MALLQVQATLVSFIAAILSFVLGLVMPRTASVAEDSAAARVFLSARRPLRPSIPYDPQKPKSGLAEWVMLIAGYLTLFLLTSVPHRFVMVASTAMSSACLSSLILGSFMCTLVVFCRKFSLNPGIPLLLWILLYINLTAVSR